jgi:hydroxymethylpyrimidine pyrophosphatase-like HAD family hydrolase
MYQATEAERARFDEAVAYIQQTYGDRVDVFRACARIADIHAKGCSKLASARELQRQLGRKILVCVGDAENDLPMMEGADYAWCPADGVIADRFETVCPCGEGAVADVIFEKIPKILGLQP